MQNIHRHISALILGGLALSPPVSAQTTERVSFSPMLGESTQPTAEVALSADGTCAAFIGGEFGPTPSSAIQFLYVRDLATGQIQNLTPTANGSSARPEFSTDGQWIVFDSFASNLAPQSVAQSALIVNLHTLQILQVSRDTSGDAIRGFAPDVSADGRHVVYHTNEVSAGTGIVDPNGLGWDVVVMDRLTGQPHAMSVANGSTGDGASKNAVISDDGRWVVFESFATDLVPDDTNNRSDIFAADRDADGNGVFDEGPPTLRRLSLAPGGVEANGQCIRADLSSDGSHLLFLSDASNLNPPTVGFYHPYLLDRDPDGNGVFDEGNFTLIEADEPLAGGNPVGSSAYAQLSRDGQRVVFTSSAVGLPNPNGHQEIYVYDAATDMTHLASISTSGEYADASSGPQDDYVAIDGDGDQVIYTSEASNLGTLPDTNGVRDVYTTTLCLGSVCELGTPVCAGVPNSTGQPGRLTLNGSARADLNHLCLDASQLPSSTIALAIMGQMQVSIPNVGGGQGTLCIGPGLARLGLVQTDAAGTSRFVVDLENLPPGTSVLAGQTWLFQQWYRDQNPSSTSNLTEAVELTFQ